MTQAPFTVPNTGLKIDNTTIVSDNNEIIINTVNGNQQPDTTWELRNNGSIVFPDSTVQLTAYPGLRSSGWALQYGSNTLSNEITTNTFDSTFKDESNNIYFFGSTKDELDGTTRPLIVKVDNDGSVLWSTIITDYVGIACGGHIVNGEGSYIVLYVSDVTDNQKTRLLNYLIDIDSGQSLNSASSFTSTNSAVGINIQDTWAFSPSGTVAIGWSGFTTNDSRTVNLIIMSDPAPSIDTFSVLKTDVPGLNLDSYQSSYIDTTNVITGFTDNETYWTITTENALIDFTTGSHTVTISQSSNATISIQSFGGNIWKSIGRAGNTFEYYRSTALDTLNGYVYAVGYDNDGGSIVSSFNTDLTVNWHKNINFGLSSLLLTGVVTDYLGNIYVVGDNDSGGGVITKLTSAGNVVWQTKLDSTSQPWGSSYYNIAINSNNDIIVAAGNYGSISSQGGDIFLVKLNIDGSIIWQRSIGTTFDDVAGGQSNILGLNNTATRFLSIDSDNFYLALATNFNGSISNATAIKLPINGNGLGYWGDTYNLWLYKVESWQVTTVDVSADATAITNLIVSDLNYTVDSITPTIQQPTIPTKLSILGDSNINTGNVTFNGDLISVDGNNGNYPILINKAGTNGGGPELDFESETLSHAAWLNGVDGFRISLNKQDSNILKDWAFTPDGTLTLPSGGIISEGTATGALGSQLQTVEITPNGGGSATQKLVIYPTAAEGNHIHLTSGDLTATDIFLGNDAQYIRTTTDGGMVIGTNVIDPTSSSSGNQWDFSVNGSTKLPGSLIKSTITNTNSSGDPVYPTPIDLTKSVNKLSTGYYTLADGVEGQILYLVPQTLTTYNSTIITVANARILNNSGATTATVYTNIVYVPFDSVHNITTMIFTDGAWQSNSGVWD